jgi:hypothetical protein
MWMLGLMSAMAAPPACGEVPLKGWQEALDASEEALRAGELARAEALLTATTEQLPCVSAVVPTQLLSRLGRQIAYQRMLAFDEVEAEQWLALSVSVDPDGAWPAWVPDRPVVRRLGGTELPPVARVDGGLVVPEGGGVFLDGGYLTTPEARVEVPHLLQVADDQGRITAGRWMMGAAFPPEVLGPDVPVPAAPLWFTDPVDPAVARRQRRAQRGSAALGVAALAGALYGSAWMARGAYAEHPTDGLRTVVNGTTAASGGVAVVALGAGVWALVGR